MTPGIAARLADLDISLIAETDAYSIFERAGCLAVVPRSEAGFAFPGSSGIMTQNGLAYLVWREGRPLLVAKQTEIAADAGQVETIRRFSADLQAALGLLLP